MCICNPLVKTPWCGKPGCEIPPQVPPPDAGRIDPSGREQPIREREQKATKGPWTNGIRGGDAHMCQIVARNQGEHGHNYVVGRTWDPQHIVSYVGLSRQQNVDNAEFMAHAREDIPYLLDQLTLLRQTVEQQQQEIDRLKGATLDVATEKMLRKYLWLGHGHQGQYGDDGEMQCGRCAPLWDYRRSPLADVIRQAIDARRAVNIEALRTAKAAGEDR